MPITPAQDVGQRTLAESTSLGISAPTAGNLLILGAGATSSTSLAGLTVPAGFTEAVRTTTSTATGCAVFYKIADGTEGTSVDVSCAGANMVFAHLIELPPPAGASWEANPVDVTGEADRTNTSITVTASGPTSQAETFEYAVVDLTGNATFSGTWTNGWAQAGLLTNRASAATHQPGVIETPSTTADWSTSRSAKIVLAAFRVPAAGGGGSPVTVSPGVASSTAAAFAPLVSSSLTASPDPASSTAAAVAPTVTGTVTASPALAGAAPTAHGPTVTLAPDGQAVAPGLAGSPATALAPTVTTTVATTPTPAGSPGSALAPAVTTSLTVAPGVAGSPAVALAPSVSSAGSVTPDLAGAPATAHPPTVSSSVTVTPAPAGQAASTHPPVVSVEGGPLTVVPARAGVPATATGPTVSTRVTVSPGPAVATPEAFGPAVAGSVTVTPGGAASIATAYGPVVVPTVTLGPGLAGSPAVAHGPRITGAGLPDVRDVTVTVTGGTSRRLTATGTSRDVEVVPAGARQLAASGPSSRQLTAAGTSRTLTANPQE